MMTTKYRDTSKRVDGHTNPKVCPDCWQPVFQGAVQHAWNGRARRWHAECWREASRVY
jgi:hypothetical protein